MTKKDLCIKLVEMVNTDETNREAIAYFGSRLYGKGFIDGGVVAIVSSLVGIKLGTLILKLKIKNPKKKKKID